VNFVFGVTRALCIFWICSFELVLGINKSY